MHGDPDQEKQSPQLGPLDEVRLMMNNMDVKSKAPCIETAAASAAAM